MERIGSLDTVRDREVRNSTYINGGNVVTDRGAALGTDKSPKSMYRGSYAYGPRFKSPEFL